jgi:hypothetical protein
MRYNKQLLDSFVEKSNATIIGNTDQLNYTSIIDFICYCGNTNSKKFTTLVRKGGELYCKKCTIKRAKEKRIQTNLNNYGVKNAIHSKEIQDNIKKNNLEKYGVEHHFSRKDIIEKRKNTNLLRYGVENTLSLENIKTKIKNTNIERYGVSNPTQCTIIRERVKNTVVNKYGVEYISQNQEIQEKIKQTNLIKYGVEHSLQSDIIKKKGKITNLKRYGVEYPIQCEEIQEKIKQSNLKKYGVEHISQNQEIQEKIQKTAKKYKEYLMPSGNIRKVQGYEPFALDILIKKYKEEQIKTNRKDIPRMKYRVNEKDKYYFPDIYIPDENKIIEVKSTWTYKCKTDNINLKKEACISQGYNYEIWCFSSKGEKIDIETL